MLCAYPAKSRHKIDYLPVEIGQNNKLTDGRAEINMVCLDLMLRAMTKELFKVQF